MAKTLAHRGIKKPDVAEVIEMIANGVSHREIGKKYGVTGVAVMGWVNAPQWALQSARAMADSGLEIRSMTATTRHGTADDVFRVTDSGGELPEEGLLGMLRMRLRELG